MANGIRTASLIASAILLLSCGSPARASDAGNISAYRSDMLSRLASNWHKTPTIGTATLIITVLHDGKIADFQLVDDPGNKAALPVQRMISATKLRPLPDWFKGEQLQFKVSTESLDEFRGSPRPQKLANTAPLKVKVNSGVNQYRVDDYPTTPTENELSHAIGEKPEIQAKICKAPQTIVERTNAFGFNLLGKNIAKHPDSNVVISPTSLSMALDMVASAASGQTLSEILKALSNDGVKVDILNAATKNYLTRVEQSQGGDILEIANGLFVNKNVQLAPTFANTLKENYHAAVQPVDFATPESVATVNHWVDEKTHHKIQGLMDRPMPDLKMLLANAVYFKGRWLHQFDKKQTRPDVFHSAKGDQTVSFMHQHSHYMYVTDPTMQAVMLPYRNAADPANVNKEFDGAQSQRTRMIIILPAEGQYDAVLSKLNSSWFSAVTAKMGSEDGIIALPRFKSQFSDEQTAALESLGMKRAFTNNAEFAKATTNGQPLTISKVLHKTFIDVNEEGTEAAAVTGIHVMPACVPPPPFKMTVNRPFFLAIEDSSGRVLFLGRIAHID